ncbi:DUF4259 domain-containing protein [bacterium]|nr:DUF4259 domain-containing protein [bacterium]
MGAWDIGSFDNDTACDWAFDIEESKDLTKVTTAIDAVFKESYIDSEIACEAIAAIETIAHLKGHGGKSDAYTESIENWVKSLHLVVPETVINRATEALSKILSDEDPSEIYELWQESNDFEVWKSDVEGLKLRINLT